MTTAARDQRPVFGWTEDREALLSKMWMEGCSGSEIARALGPPFTRNSVGGKVRDLGLKREEKRKRPLAPKQVAAPVELAPVAPAAAAAVCETTEGVSLADLRNGHCRWIEGEPDGAATVFCGAMRRPGVPYCGTHALRAYRPAEERRRRAA